MTTLTPAEIAAKLRHGNLDVSGDSRHINALLRLHRDAADTLDRLSAEHDRRVTELLAANNAEVERRRAAESSVAELEAERDAVQGMLADPVAIYCGVLRGSIAKPLAWQQAEDRATAAEARERAIRSALRKYARRLRAGDSAEVVANWLDHEAALSAPATEPAAPDVSEAVGWRGLAERMDAESVAMEASFAEARAAGLLPKEDGNG